MAAESVFQVGVVPFWGMADDDSRPTAVLISNIKRLRRQRGLTAQQLSERLTDLGVNIGRVGVAKMEGGNRRSISIEEVFALALALNVSPLTLLIPEDEQAEYAVTPANTVSSKAAGLWITGSRPLRIGSSTNPFDQPWIAWVGALPAWKGAEYSELLKTFEDELRKKGQTDD